MGLAYLIMSDGSLSASNVMILHTQGFTFEENLILSKELNDKFNLHSFVHQHKKKYWVIKFPSSDASQLKTLILAHIIPSIMYKVPNV